GVGDDQLLEAGDVGAVVVGAAQVLWQHRVGDVVLDQDLQLLEDAFAVLGDRGVRRPVQLRSGRALTGRAARVGPAAQQRLGDLGDVEAGRAAGEDRDRAGRVGGGLRARGRSGGPGGGG